MQIKQNYNDSILKKITLVLFRIPSKNHWNFHESIGSITINATIHIEL